MRRMCSIRFNWNFAIVKWWNVPMFFIFGVILGSFGPKFTLPLFALPGFVYLGKHDKHCTAVTNDITVIIVAVSETDRPGLIMKSLGFIKFIFKIPLLF